MEWPAIGGCAPEVHGDGGVAARIPHRHPLAEGGAAAAVHEHHAGKRALARRGGVGQIRDTEVRKDTRRPALIQLAFVQDRADTDFGLAGGLVWRWCFETGEVPESAWIEGGHAGGSVAGLDIGAIDELTNELLIDF